MSRLSDARAPAMESIRRCTSRISPSQITSKLLAELILDPTTNIISSDSGFDRACRLALGPNDEPRDGIRPVGN